MKRALSVIACGPKSSEPNSEFRREREKDFCEVPPGQYGPSCFASIYKVSKLLEIDQYCSKCIEHVTWATQRSQLSGPLNRLNAILSLLHAFDRYSTPSAIGGAIGRPLSRPISHPNTGGSPQPPRSKPLGGLNRAIVVL